MPPRPVPPEDELLEASTPPLEEPDDELEPEELELLELDELLDDDEDDDELPELDEVTAGVTLRATLAGGSLEPPQAASARGSSQGRYFMTSPTSHSVCRMACSQAALLPDPRATPACMPRRD